MRERLSKVFSRSEENKWVTSASSFAGSELSLGDSVLCFLFEFEAAAKAHKNLAAFVEFTGVSTSHAALSFANLEANRPR